MIPLHLLRYKGCRSRSICPSVVHYVQFSYAEISAWMEYAIRDMLQLKLIREGEEA